MSLEGIDSPYVFWFTLNKESTSRQPNHRMCKSKLLLLAQDQDMVMPEEEKCNNRATIYSNMAEIMDDQPLDYNYEDLMYCICIRFNCLLSS